MVQTMNYSAKLTSKEAEERGCLVLLRHGETEWSKSGQYTGRTDLPLVDEGRQQARKVGQRLAHDFPEGFDDGCMLVSPLQRAQETAQLAGFSGVQTLDALAEWDYGRAEGRKSSEIDAELGWDWMLWRDGPQAIDERLGGDRQAPLPSGGSVFVRNSDGESLKQAAQRALTVVHDVQPMVESGHRVLLVAHAHILRIVTTQWLGLDPADAQLFRLDTAHYAVLSRYQGSNVLKRWNC
ncbi:histidine phosphatase family protein [Bombiscardovia coagulans]|uniref:phosphoglycerate mutase (2,3-diphosphoglycerate-dependent) n=1 Tax=Bombiscardovia coagulans TaxID=686666 RepID=A0A261EUD1_9BIFI|nr:histidine phosphatase family protein [Bombiscardovia coagulans]OZG50435.1 histidine phosphatase [Bombiscardovia coagulans]